jgi:hypothetical protein
MREILKRVLLVLSSSAVVRHSSQSIDQQTSIELDYRVSAAQNND